MPYVDESVHKAHCLHTGLYVLRCTGVICLVSTRVYKTHCPHTDLCVLRRTGVICHGVLVLYVTAYLCYVICDESAYIQDISFTYRSVCATAYRRYMSCVDERVCVRVYIS